MRRRNFMKWGAAGAGAALLAPWMRSGALAFGEFPDAAKSLILPVDRQAQSVLEIFLYGGLSCWETLYFVAEYGTPNDPMFPNSQYYALNNGGSASIQSALAQCSVSPEEAAPIPFALDENNAQVHLGPFAHRLSSRPDILARMRLVTQKHKLEPHEAAVPQALTGRPVGQPSAAGLGAHVQRFFGERAEVGRAAPYSYLFATGGISGDNVSAATNTGMHPGSARPLQIKIDNAERFANLLGRPEVGSLDSRNKYDQMMDVYIKQYKQRLRWKGQGDPVRSPHFTDLSLAAQSVGNVDAVAAVLDGSLFVAKDGRSCNQKADFDIPAMSLGAARHLLTHPTQPARYVCVSDIGLFEASGGGGYDTHTDNSFDTARNFDNMLRSLVAMINQPGENDPSKIDLDKTMIILNTEFGRTPKTQNGSGRNHYPYAYVTSFIGGPITEAEKGIYGSIGPDALPGNAVSPAENRIGALLALGIWPFSPEAFAVSDVISAGDEAEAAAKATSHILGIEV